MPHAVPSLAALIACAAAAVVGLSAAPAAAQPGARQDQCFLSSNINGFHAPDDHTVYIRVGVNDIYRLDLMGHCADLTFRQGFGLESTPGDPWICQPIQAEIVYRETGIPMRCPVTGIHRLTPAELAALPKGDRP
jgi:hypothetical protein